MCCHLIHRLSVYVQPSAPWRFTLADAWRSLIRSVLVAGAGDKTSGWGWMLVEMKRNCTFFFLPLYSTFVILILDNLHNKEARWAPSLSLCLSRLYCMCVCVCVCVVYCMFMCSARESLSSSSWHWRRLELFLYQLFAFHSGVASQRFIDKREPVTWQTQLADPQMTRARRPRREKKKINDYYWSLMEATFIFLSR